MLLDFSGKWFSVSQTQWFTIHHLLLGALISFLVCGQERELS